MQGRRGTFSNSLLCYVVVNNVFGLICKPYKLLSGAKGICSKVGCTAAAESLSPLLYIGGAGSSTHFRLAAAPNTLYSSNTH